MQCLGVNSSTFYQCLVQVAVLTPNIHAFRWSQGTGEPARKANRHMQSHTKETLDGRKIIQNHDGLRSFSKRAQGQVRDRNEQETGQSD